MHVLSWCIENLELSLFPVDHFHSCNRLFSPLLSSDLDSCPALCDETELKGNLGVWRIEFGEFGRREWVNGGCRRQVMGTSPAASTMRRSARSLHWRLLRMARRWSKLRVRPDSLGFGVWSLWYYRVCSGDWTLRRVAFCLARCLYLRSTRMCRQHTRG